eukprot:CAMPEP_0114619806 /NCGR_PEP_ID=MMETSP0168-20121206/8398_1 /TAXON_ID=95228 ORGANISM="Vannella sp., Strain DIVA3 517/6/12" /NCGR_SAMPLE_ID=MMETSP0168 /ASSEMBLY_ACC=CAM_ASM_000044 /LENGTH=276 /DNA_ID=CAMNT_0001830975 /DNA_START=1 /DNA_END=828 /DNA_ORIENTATION=+
MTAGDTEVELLTYMAASTVEEMEAEVAELEQVKEAAEKEMQRRQALINRIQHQRVSQGVSASEELEKKQKEVADLQRLVSRSLTVSKTCLSFLDQATLAQGQVPPAVLQKLPKIDVAHEHVISAYNERADAVAAAVAKASAPAPAPVAPSVSASPAPLDRAAAAAAATPPMPSGGQQQSGSGGQIPTLRSSGDDGRRSSSGILAFPPAAVYGTAPAPPSADAQPLPTPAEPVADFAPAAEPPQRSLPSHIRMIAPEPTGPQPMAMPMGRSAGTATV